MKSLLMTTPVFLLCVATVLAAPGGNIYRRAQKAEKAKSYDSAAHLYEQAARLRTGKSSAEAWFRAGRNWVDPGNPKQSYGRAMACFQRVDISAANQDIVRDTKTWLSVLSRLVTAQETAREADQLKSALEDAAQGSRALHQQPAP